MEQNWPVSSPPGDFNGLRPIYSGQAQSCLGVVSSYGVVWVQWRPGPLQWSDGPVFLCCALLAACGAGASPSCERQRGTTRLCPLLPARCGSHLYITPERSHKEGILSHVSGSRTCGSAVWFASRRMPAGEESLLVLQEVRTTGWNAAEPARNLRKNLETGTSKGFELPGWREMVRCCE